MKINLDFYLTTIIVLLFIPIASGNTGWWQFSHEDDNIRALLSPSRFSIFANENIHMIFGVINSSKASETTDIAQHFLKDFDAQIKIFDINLQNLVFESEKFYSPDGFVELDYIFPKESFYELNMIVAYGEKNFTFDFPIGVRAQTKGDSNNWLYLAIVASFFVGMFIGRTLKG